MDSNDVRLIDINEELKTSFISYAMAVIINRALPDVRDGLKPVHRRTLYSMIELGVTPDKPFRKSVRIVGDVLGKYHPHGDTAVYDSMVRMAQDFSTRYMLVEGQGNFGSVDGDGAAAMRYTEARLSKIAMEMVADIDKETVDFDPNFDGSAVQPSVLPARYPNLLVNGSSGIAVGMATNIPPHNLGEIIDGTVALIDNPDITLEEIMQHIKGPDFPTGGLIMGLSGIRDAYSTGRGRVVMRAKHEIEPMSLNRSRIVVTEIPYVVNKSKMIEKIAELVHEKRVDGISDIRDESSRAGMRVVIELKRDVNPTIILNYLYKHTSMQETFGVNMLALVDNEPRVLSLIQVLKYYVEHQREVITRRTQYELNKAEARAHILEGLLRALDMIDEIINCIRSSKTTQIAREALVEQFAFSEKQASAILDMRLQRLTGLERDRLSDEYNELSVLIAHLKEILANEWMVMDIIKTELLEIKAKFNDPRRSELTPLVDEINIGDLIQEEDMVVTLTRFGYVKRLSLDTYRAQRRGGRGITALSTREEDVVMNLFITSTHCDLYFFTSRGRVYKKKCYEIPEAGRQAKGTAIINLIELESGEKVNAVIPVEADNQNNYFIMATRDGMIKKTAMDEFTHLRSSGLIAINLRDEDELIAVRMTDGNAEVMLGTRKGMAIRFSETDARPLGRATMGVKSMELDPGDEVVDMSIVDETCKVLSISSNGYGKRTEIEAYRMQSRGGKGTIAMRLNDKTGDLVAQLLVHEDEDLMLITDDGTVIRTPVDSISVISRTTQGVKLMRLADSAKVVAVARAPKQDEYEEEEIGEETAEGTEAEAITAEPTEEVTTEATEEVTTEATEEVISDDN